MIIFLGTVINFKLVQNSQQPVSTCELKHSCVICLYVNSLTCKILLSKYGRFILQNCYPTNLLLAHNAQAANLYTFFLIAVNVESISQESIFAGCALHVLMDTSILQVKFRTQTCPPEVPSIAHRAWTKCMVLLPTVLTLKI